MKKSDKLELEETLKSVIAGLVNTFDEELQTSTQEELEKYWFFVWDDDSSVQWNTYQFFDLLNLYANHCRRWEEKHNGSVCVVERVRDKYVMQKISSFLDKLSITNNV
jgi:hypothetical protein